MCLTPKYLHIKSADGSPHEIIVPCGRCSECQNKKRGEFVFRCKTERDNSCKSWFLTLTYSDSNLIFFDSLTRREGRKSELERISKLPADCPFKYSRFILSRSHARKFCFNMQKKIKTINSNALFRIVYAGEYGTFSHRPHLHCLFFTPFNLDDETFKRWVTECWLYGDIDIKPCGDGAINYIAKHFVKDDCGSEIQQRVSPRFLYYSRFKGSIGRDLLFDRRVLRNFENGVYYDVTGKYKVPLPRFIRKKLRGNMSDEELSLLSSKSFDDFKLNYYDTHGYAVSSSDSLESVVQENFKENIDKENLQKLKHKKLYFQKKILKLQRKGYFNNDDEKHV